MQDSTHWITIESIILVTRANFLYTRDQVVIQVSPPYHIHVLLHLSSSSLPGIVFLSRQVSSRNKSYGVCSPVIYRSSYTITSPNQSLSFCRLDFGRANCGMLCGTGITTAKAEKKTSLILSLTCSSDSRHYQFCL